MPSLPQAARELLAAVRCAELSPDTPGAEALAYGFEGAPADAVEALRAKYGLSEVYAEFLRRFATRDFFDSGLNCAGVACWLGTCADMEDMHWGYAEAEGWPEGWFVIGLDYEGCYILDRDGEVLFLNHCEGLDAYPVAEDFVSFLETVARDSSGGHRWSPLHRAVIEQRAAEVEALADEVDEQALRYAWALAADHGWAEGCRLLEGAGCALSTEQVRARLQLLAQRSPAPGADPLVEMLLERADEQALGLALVAASGAGSVTWARELLERGAPVNFLDPVVIGGSSAGLYTWTPLTRAAAEGRVEITALLLDHGADARLGAEGVPNPVELAAIRGERELVGLLMARGGVYGEATNAEEVFAVRQQARERAATEEAEPPMSLGQELLIYAASLVIFGFLGLLLCGGVGSLFS